MRISDRVTIFFQKFEFVWFDRIMFIFFATVIIFILVAGAFIIPRAINGLDTIGKNGLKGVVEEIWYGREGKK